MKRNFSCLLALSALILMAGCKKSFNSTVDLSQKAKAGFAPDPLWQTPGPYTRIIRYDIDDGHGSDCIFAFDLVSGKVSLNQISGANTTQIYAGTGIPTTNAGTIDVTQDHLYVSDNFNEIGGVHIIPYDYSGTGHEDHLLIYIPGDEIFYLLSYAGNGKWTQLLYATNGIGGYDIAATYDKIIAYDFSNSGYKKDLICYRPTQGIFYCLQNNGNLSNPFTAVVKSTGGVGGYDLHGASDQLVAEEGGAGNSCDLVAYRPGYGYVFWMNHTANSPSWQTVYSTRSGFPYFPLSHEQDRMFAFNYEAYYGEDDGYGFWYSPGNGPSGSCWDYWWEGDYVDGYWQISIANWPFSYNPYAAGNTTYTGDHVLCLSAASSNNPGVPVYNALLFYTNGAVQSQLYEGYALFYNQVY